MNFKLIFDFLTELKTNNNKAWFDVNRDRYHLIKKELELFTAEWIIALGKLDVGIASLDSKKCGFRINRDIRFSNNKDPYKTNMGIFLNPGGKSAWNAGYYLHIEPNNCFFAAGNHQPESIMLGKIRQEIDYNLQDFESIILNKPFNAIFGAMRNENTLKKSPKGYDDTNPAIAYLRLKEFIVSAKIEDDKIINKLFINDLIELSTIAFPFVDFLNKAID